MEHGPPRFERDRQRFSYLCREILHRLSEHDNDRYFPSIEGLAREIQDLELPQRLGFAGSPLFAEVRQLPEVGTQHLFCWNEPQGASGEVLVRSFSTRTPSEDSLGPSYRTEARRTLCRVIRGWLRAIKHLVEPADYPHLPTALPVGMDRSFGRDPLWRTLAHVVELLSREFESPGDQRAPDSLQPWLRKLNHLTKYEGLCEDGLFRAYCEKGGLQAGLLVSTPGAAEPRILRFRNGYHLDATGLRELASILVRWQESREKILVAAKSTRGQLVGTEPGEAPALADLSPAEREAWTGFEVARRALERDESIAEDRPKPTLRHWEWLTENQPLRLRGRARDNFETWAAYVRKAVMKLYGRVRGRLPESAQGRSWVRPGDL